MNISKNTLSVLSNFASINQNILIKPGNVLSTRTVAKNIYVEATVEDSFDQQFGVYNLNELIGIISLFSDPTFEVSQNTLTISQGKNKVKYIFASPEVLDYPDKPIKMPDYDAKFELSEENLKSLIKAGAVLSASDLLISGNGQTIMCTVLDPKNPSSNTFSIDVGDTDRVFSGYIKLESLKLPSGIYDVFLSSKKITHFKNKTMKYSFYVANEKNSSWA